VRGTTWSIGTEHGDHQEHQRERHASRHTNADRDARLVGQNLVLDMNRLFEREAGVPLDLGQQHLVLVGVTSFDTDQLL